MKKLLIILLICLSIHSAEATELILWKEHRDAVVLERYYLQKIFTKKIAKWPDGRNINVYIKPFNSIEHKDFLSNVLGLSPFSYQQQLETQTFTGKSASVTEVDDDAELILKVERDPSAIGYINYEIYIGNKKVIVINSSAIH